MKISNNDIHFYPLQDNHYLLLHKWMTSPHVAQHWTQEENCETFKEKYFGASLWQTMFAFIVFFGIKPVGYVQYYTTDTNNEVGIHILLGDAHMLNKGYGTMVLKKFIHELWKNPDIHTIIITPKTTNEAAIRSYEKSGFKATGKIRDSVLMEMTQKEAT